MLLQTGVFGLSRVINKQEFKALTTLTDDLMQVVSPESGIYYQVGDMKAIKIRLY